jgi:prophage maintenance system killer protein
VVLTAADVRLINRVAARRFAGVENPAIDDAQLAKALAAQTADQSAYARATALTAALLAGSALLAAPKQTALLALHCSLSLDGVVLLAPQGVVAGMINDLAAGADVAAFVRWLEDRAVPSTGG